MEAPAEEDPRNIRQHCVIQGSGIAPLTLEPDDVVARSEVCFYWWLSKNRKRCESSDSHWCCIF